ncbi:MAG: PQ-loop domain-containing transporter [bacterium]
MDAWEYLNLAASVGFTVALIPQLGRTLKRRRAQDISVPFAALVILSSACLLPYMVHYRNWPFAVAQGVNLLVWGVVLYYRLWPAPGTVPARPDSQP